MARQSTIDYNTLAQRIKHWGRELGFQQVGIADTGLEEAEGHLERWLDQGFHGEMAYMHEHGRKRTRPADLVPASRLSRLECLPIQPRPAFSARAFSITGAESTKAR